MSSFTAEQVSEPFWKRHKGPFKFCVSRPFVPKKNFFRSEWLTGGVEGDEVEEEALALLTDPRDTIVEVSVWSEREEQFVFHYRRPSVGS